MIPKNSLPRPRPCPPSREQEKSMRPSRRQPDELRAESLERDVVKYAEGSGFVPAPALRRERTARRYVLNGQPAIAPPMPPALYLVATPIGNLRDITLRALEVLAAADLIACEDTRRSRKLLDHYAITTPVTPYHDHNAAAARPKLIAPL